MAIAETVKCKNTYTNYKDSYNMDALTTIYEVGLFAQGGLNLFNLKLYSRFMPDLDNIDKYLEDKSDLMTGMYQAVKNVFSETNYSTLTELTSADGRTTRFFGFDDFYLTVTYDRNREKFKETEDLIEALAKKGIDYLKESSELANFKETGVAIGLEIESKLKEMFDIGYNNEKMFGIVSKLLDELDKKATSYSFLGAEGIEEAKKNIIILEKIHKLFPALDINLDKYVKSIEFTEKAVEKKEKELSELARFRKNVKNYGESIINLIEEGNYKEAEQALVFPDVFSGIKNEKVVELKKKMKEWAAKLEKASGMEKKLASIEVKELIESSLIYGSIRLNNY